MDGRGPAPDGRGLAAQRLRRVGDPLLRGRGTHRGHTVRRWPATVRAQRAAAPGLHPRRVQRRPHPRGDPRGAGPAARQPHPHEGRLAAHLAALAPPARRADRGAGAARDGLDVVHRVRLPEPAGTVPSPTPATSTASAVRAPGCCPTRCGDRTRRGAPPGSPARSGRSEGPPGDRVPVDYPGEAKERTSASMVAVRSRWAMIRSTGVPSARMPLARSRTSWRTSVSRSPTASRV